MPERRPIVLVVDDDPADQLILRRAAAEGFSGAVLEMANSGPEALSYFDDPGPLRSEESSPDLVFLDLNMPGMDGLSTLRALRRRMRSKATPIIVLTTSSSIKDVIESYEAGANTFITKPSSFDDLVAVLKIVGAYWCGAATLPTVGNAARCQL